MNTDYQTLDSKVSLVKSLANVFENAPIDTLTSDTAFLNDCISRITSTTHLNWDRCLILLVLLHHYEKTVDINTISLPMKGFISSIALEIISSLNFVKVFQIKELYELYNNFLISNFGNCNEFQVQRLYESYVRCKEVNSDKTLFFFQMFLVDQLFRNHLYSKIAFLIKNFKIEDFESIFSPDEKYINNNLLSYFHSLGYSLIMEGSLDKAYELITTTLLITVEKIELPIFHLLLTEIAYLTLRLNVPYERMSIIIMKYRVKLLPRVLDLLQNYYAYDYESFLCNYTLMVLYFKNRRQNLMLSLFNERFLTDCINQLLQSKADILMNISDSTSVDQIEDLFNKRIEEINSKYADYLMRIEPFKICAAESTLGQNIPHPLRCTSLALTQSILKVDRKA